jgi:hypothetical protein
MELQGLTLQLSRLAGVTEAELAGANPPLGWLFLGFLAWQSVQVVAAAVAGFIILRGDGLRRGVDVAGPGL